MLLVYVMFGVTVVSLGLLAAVLHFVIKMKRGVEDNRSHFDSRFVVVENEVSHVHERIDAMVDKNGEDLEKAVVQTQDFVRSLNLTQQAVDNLSSKHHDYHEGMLDKLNKAGDLIVGYESFYEGTMAELEEMVRFMDIISKRPVVSTDPDFVNFQRAVQLMGQVVSKYTSVASSLKSQKESAKLNTGNG